jgi:hypothetical protein|tara:strand:- start:56 stop:886 length:831 start_codon:yes stop_codon:yes gene_type:complete
MRSRTLKRPMFRMGGSSGTGITSGLDRPGYKNGTDPRQLLPQLGSLPTDFDRATKPKPTGIGMGTLPGFLTSLGLNIATARPTGNIFSTVAGAAKEPFETFQQAKFAEAKEEREFERERELQMLKNLDEDSRSAIMKQAEEGFEAGLYSSVNEGIRRLLQTKEFGVADRPGEALQKRIDRLVDVAVNAPGVDPMEEPIIRNQITTQQNYKNLTENNPNVDFADQFNMFLKVDLETKAITNTNLTPGKVYYSGVTDEFFLFNGPDAETKFTKVDIKR